MKLSNVIPFPPRPKPARQLPVLGVVGSDGRVVFTKPPTQQ